MSEPAARLYDVEGYEEFYTPEGNVMLESTDGYCFRVHDFMLKTTSLTFRDLLTMPSTDDKEIIHINLDEDGVILQAWLYLLHHYAVDETSLCRLRDDQKINARIEQVKTLMRMCNKYQTDELVKLVQRYCSDTAKMSSTAIWPCFVLACNYRWERVAKDLLLSFGQLGTSLATHKFATASIPPPTPKNLSLEEHIRPLGLAGYAAYVKAYDYGRHEDSVDWASVSWHFSLNKV